MSLTQDNIGHHQTQIAAYNRHDAEAVASTYMPETVVIDHAFGQTLTGPDEVRAYLQSLFDGFPDDHFEEAEIIAAGEWTVARFVGRGTHEGAWGGLDPTHRKTETNICNVLRWQDGKVAEEHIYYDAYGLLAQLGQVPPLEIDA